MLQCLRDYVWRPFATIVVAFYVFTVIEYGLIRLFA